MKKLLITLLLLPLFSNAQSKHSVFADLNATADGAGLSLVYSYKLAGSFCVGVGAQGIYDNIRNKQRGAIFSDFRFQWPIAHGLLFFHMNAGAGLHDSYISGNATVPPVTIYTGLGLGYAYIINKRGMGPYVSFRIWSESYTYSQFDYYLQREYKTFNLDAMPVVAVGFKF